MRPHENPFRSERIEALAFRPVGTDWPALWARLDALQFRAAIVGPDGTGKTTLLEEIARRLEADGRPVRREFITLDIKPRRGQFGRRWRETLRPEEIICFDGADHLSRWAWQQVQQATQQCAGLIITSHRPGLLEPLIETHSSPTLLAELTAELLGEPATNLDIDIDALFTRVNGNLRNALRSLYLQAMSRSLTDRSSPATSQQGQGSNDRQT